MKEHAAIAHPCFRVIHNLLHKLPTEQRFAAEKDDPVMTAVHCREVNRLLCRIEGHIRRPFVYIAVGAGKIAAVRDV